MSLFITSYASRFTDCLMEHAYILAHDIGTSAIKSFIMDARATIVASEQSPNITLSDATGKAEQESHALWSGVRENTRTLSAKHPELTRHIAGIGLSGHMLDCLPVDNNGNPLHNILMRGVYFSDYPPHTRVPILLVAVVEGVTFALKSILASLQDFIDIHSLHLIGGGAQLAAWPQMLADTFGFDVSTPTTDAKDATSLGAAINAGVGIGLFKDFQEGVQSIRNKETYSARSEKSDTYEKLFAVYTALYPHVKSVFQNLRHIST